LQNEILGEILRGGAECHRGWDIRGVRFGLSGGFSRTWRKNPGLLGCLGYEFTSDDLVVIGGAGGVCRFGWHWVNRENDPLKSLPGKFSGLHLFCIRSVGFRRG
jgi:hypothetical protein